jgi:hypothetical protein
MARGSFNKKLLEPPGCQESSAPVKITAALMANSIATQESSKSSIFPHCSKANSMELAAGHSSTKGRHVSRTGVSNETGSELGRRVPADSSSEYRRK